MKSFSFFILFHWFFFNLITSQALTSSLGTEDKEQIQYISL